jgi:predicted house-cleaning noncanonical NTP pyrophosphatase (MazG superfamily)
MCTLEMQTSLLNEEVIWWKFTNRLRGELTELPDVLEPVRRIEDTENFSKKTYTEIVFFKKMQKVLF